jgi:hypothetical protein
MTMKILQALALTAILTGAAGPTMAQDATSQDASCLVLAMAAAQSADPTTKQNGMMAQSYFMGRLDARAAPNLSAVINAQVSAMTAARAKAENARCTMLIDNRVKAMRAVLSQVKPQV